MSHFFRWEFFRRERDRDRTKRAPSFTLDGPIRTEKRTEQVCLGMTEPRAGLSLSILARPPHSSTALAAYGYTGTRAHGHTGTRAHGHTCAVGAARRRSLRAERERERERRAALRSSSNSDDLMEEWVWPARKFAPVKLKSPRISPFELNMMTFWAELQSKMGRNFMHLPSLN